MANYYGFGRSNYFKVKDIEDFKRLLANSECTPIWKGSKKLSEIDTSDLVGFLCTSEDGQPTADEDVDFFNQLSTILDQNYVVIFQSIGNEKLRYLNGYSIAIDARGNQLHISLDDIYGKAQSHFDNETITEAIY